MEQKQPFEKTEELISWTGMTFDKYSDQWQLDNIAYVAWVTSLDEPLATLIRDLLANAAMTRSFSWFEFFHLLSKAFFHNKTYSVLDEGVALSFISSRSISERPKAKSAIIFLYEELQKNKLFQITEHVIKKINTKFIRSD